MSDALSQQHGGTHYKKLKIQPVEFAIRNRWDFPLGSSLKYLTRWRDKAGVLDLGKCKHFIELREAVMPEQPWPSVLRFEIAMETYIDANGIPSGPEAAAHLALESYAFRPSDSHRDVLFAIIDQIISAESA